MKIRLTILALCAALFTGCGVAIKYSLSGASIPPDAKTFSVAYFPNNATMVSPILSSTLTESTQLLTEVEGTLIPQIVDKLVTDIFQASASNW